MITDPVTLPPDAPVQRGPRPDGPLQDLRHPDRRRRRQARRHPHQPRPALRRGPRPADRAGDEARRRSSPRRWAPRSSRPRTSSGSTASRSCRSSTTPALLRGLITVKDIKKQTEYPHATQDDQGRLRVGAAVGVGPDAVERAEALVAVGVDLLVVDTVARPLPGRARRREDDQGRLRHRGHRRQHRHRRGGRRDGRRRRRRREGRRGPWLLPPSITHTHQHCDRINISNLHHPGRRRRRRPAAHRHLRLRRGRQAARRHAHRRRRHPALGRHPQGAGRRRRRRDARLACSPASTSHRARSSSTRASATRSTAAWARWAP